MRELENWVLSIEAFPTSSSGPMGLASYIFNPIIICYHFLLRIQANNHAFVSIE